MLVLGVEKHATYVCASAVLEKLVACEGPQPWWLGTAPGSVTEVELK